MTKSLNEIPKELQNVYLTPRETDIVKLLAVNNSTKQVANELGISLWTVYNTLSRVTRRLNSNKYDLLYKVHQMGLID